MSAKTKLDKETFPTDLQESIDNIAKSENYTKYDIGLKKSTADGGNYLGVIYEVNIKGETQNEKKETSLFVKHIISGEHMKFFSVKDAYCKEFNFYRNIATAYNELQNETQMSIEERFHLPKCYEETNPEAIILENLEKEGYMTLNRMEVVSLDFVEKSIEQLAKFHGLGFVMKKKRAKYFNENSISILKQHFILNEDWKSFMNNLLKRTVNVLNDETKTKVEKFVTNIFSLYYKYMIEPSTIRTLCHGDFRISNIMVQKEANGEIAKITLVDYQLIYQGHPLNDLMFFIFSSTDQEFRRKHLAHIKNVYYENLSKYLQYFQIDINDIFTKADFESDFKDRLYYGLLVSLYRLPLLFTVKEKAPDLSQDKLTDFKYVLDPRFHERIQGIVNDFVEWGYI